MNELTIILVEDDPLICKSFAECLDKFDDISLVSVTNNSSKALEDIKDYMPNVVILDLELHHGSGSGLDVLRGLEEMSDSIIKPYVLITTNNTSAVTYECARNLGADYILSKHQDNYSEKTVVDFLNMMKPAILSRKQLQQVKQTTKESPNIRSKRIRQRIMRELNNVGINPKSVGYTYLIEAIEITMEQPTQNICTIIGKKHGKTDFSVERAMQNAIKRAWTVTNIDDLYTYYTARITSDKGMPTITEFIHYYALKLNNEY